MGESRINTEHEKFLVSYGLNLDHSNFDFLINRLLQPYLNQEFTCKKKKKINQKAEFTFQVQTIDLNPDKNSFAYYSNQYFLTNAQLEGFKYALSKLKGTHVMCDPNIQGHAWETIEGIEFSFHVYRTLEGSYLCFYQYGEDWIADNHIRAGIQSLPENKRYLTFPADILPVERKALIRQWIKKTSKTSKTFTLNS